MIATASRERRILEALVRAHSLLRDGNPHHDSEGKFTSAGGEGHAQPHGKHHAKRQRRKARRKKRAEAVRHEYKKAAAELKASHRQERAEHVKDERKGRAELRRTQARERKATAREHAKERVSQAKGHVKEKGKWEKKWAKAKTKVEAEHAAKSAKLDKAAKQAKSLPKRHKREAARLEEHIASGQHAKDITKITADQVAKAKAAGKSAEDIAAIEARGKELGEKGATKARESLAKQHEAERAKAEGLPKLRERLTKQTEARLQRIAQGPERLAAHQAKQVKGLAHRQKREVKEQKVEHADEMKSLREDQAGERVSLKERHKEERQDLVERYESDIEEHGYRRKRRQASVDIGTGQRAFAAADRGAVQGNAVYAGDADARAGILPELGAYRARPQQSYGVSRVLVARTHKASSAESILRHILRRRGWTAAFRRGELTDRQHRTLLEDVRQYAREWMRHEAEVLFASYGREVDEPRNLDGRLQGRGGIHTSDVHGPDHSTLHREGTSGSGSADPGDDGVSRALSDTLTHHVGRWFGRAKQFVREAILAGAMALHGTEPLTAVDLREVDAQAEKQVAYLDKFQLDAHYKTPAEIGEGEPALTPMTAAQFVARAEQYGDSVHTGANAVARAKVIGSRRYTEERGFHGKLLDDMCQVCRDRVRAGWVPIGTLPAIGDSECRGQCHCYFKYRDENGNVATTVRPMRGRKAMLKRRPVLAT